MAGSGSEYLCNQGRKAQGRTAAHAAVPAGMTSERAEEEGEAVTSEEEGQRRQHQR